MRNAPAFMIGCALLASGSARALELEPLDVTPNPVRFSGATPPQVQVRVRLRQANPLDLGACTVSLNTGQGTAPLQVAFNVSEREKTLGLNYAKPGRYTIEAIANGACRGRMLTTLVVEQTGAAAQAGGGMAPAPMGGPTPGPMGGLQPPLQVGAAPSTMPPSKPPAVAPSANTPATPPASAPAQPPSPQTGTVESAFKEAYKNEQKRVAIDQQTLRTAKLAVAKSMAPDCRRDPPKIEQVLGDAAPDVQLHIRGACFGATAGKVHLNYETDPRGGYLDGLDAPIVSWRDSAIFVKVPPNLKNNGDGRIALVLTTATGVNAATVVPFFAKAKSGPIAAMGSVPGTPKAPPAQTHPVPSDKWIVGKLPGDQEGRTLDRDGQWREAHEVISKAVFKIDDRTVSDFETTKKRQFSVNVAQNCTLDKLDVVPVKGKVLSVTGWDRKSDIHGVVAVTYRDHCNIFYDRNYGVAGKTSYVCETGFRIAATAKCVHGATP